MIARGLLVATLAVAVCGCASTAPERGSQGALYMVGDNAALVRMNTAPGSMEGAGEFSVVKRLYWFFAGR
jgi:hypothetical protein